MDLLLLCIAVAIPVLVLIIFLPMIKKKISDSGPTGNGIPGLKAKDAKHGNLELVTKHGSLHEFLMWLHQQYGPIAKFWFGEQMVVSIASPQLFKENSRVFDRPPILFKLFEPLITENSIQYANKEDGRWRRNTYDPCYSHEHVMGYITIFQRLAEELVEKWSHIPRDEHVPCRQEAFVFALKAITQSSLGDFFLEEEQVVKFWKSYDICWYDMEERLGGDIPQPGSEREKKFNDAKKYMYDTIAAAIEVRRRHPNTANREMLVDVMIENNIDDDVMQSDLLTSIIGGFHTSGNLLVWTLHFISLYPEVQEKMFQEVSTVLGDTGKVTPDNVAQLVYIRQVMDETLRVAVVAPFAARFDDEKDVTLGGHVIPAGTPVIHALGVESNDPALWPNPKKFDPDRFSPENVAERQPYSFQPFGFAGKRKCPGYRFSYVEIATALANILRRFQIHEVEGQTIKAKYGLVGTPDGEVWITLSERSAENKEE
ncbi:cytochrome P450 20A1 [Lingula anatina]|uniref:Cytochrome P450 20A1 n=1 Tax=Lingula anatina TaxID=7574 RepID=A0A1S3KHD7_LINAN|nr:cytochrome P450 20A1 [Lingula anatina]XP_013421916.1 cytochrome P450 20A1 [Lingula anatina]XP_013421917.1 cytochrome P450 20A1 [Lingula anatina]XP_013421918.1 cytochrome P450 20A1 [Lingula anatina]XP_013421919.1 cytochrome P450 20A1 [Lingula anatina]XP_013421920.1 cytochrome P450 20A1 [Lingula anatina]|eukprot:XP_013421915.1 cytochrome P450 20A1 [Lingula anatina]